MIEFPQPGDEIELHYPVNTHVRHIHDAPQRLRNFRIRTVRDLLREPLLPHEFLRRPYVARSRWLISVTDLDDKTHSFKQIYLGSTTEFASPKTMRIAIYEPGRDRPTDLIGRQFEPTVFDRKLMLRILRKLATKDFATQIRIVADDLRRLG